jgi:hypothetical protein
MGCGPSIISAPARACGPVTEDSRLEELFIAARAGDTGLVSTLLDSGFYVDCTDRVRADVAWHACAPGRRGDAAHRTATAAAARGCLRPAGAAAAPPGAPGASRADGADATRRPAQPGTPTATARLHSTPLCGTTGLHPGGAPAAQAQGDTGRTRTRACPCLIRGAARTHWRAQRRALGCSGRASARLRCCENARLAHAATRRMATRRSCWPPTRTCATCCAATTQARVLKRTAQRFSHSQQPWP